MRQQQSLGVHVYSLVEAVLGGVLGDVIVCTEAVHEVSPVVGGHLYLYVDHTTL